MPTIASPLLWIGFVVVVLALLAIDLGIFHRKAHEVRTREALVWTMVWIGLAMAFNLGIYLYAGERPALEFLTGYLLEKSLSVDNIFVFAVLLSSFHVPAALQHRVLYWGVVGALVLRAIFILAGAELVTHFHWVLYGFGALLIVTAIRLLRQKEGDVHPERNPLLRLFRRLVPTTDDFRGTHFTVVEAGRRMATPLLAVLVAIEASDVIFAVDSIPAIFGVTTDPFIVFTSNVFAILGLRSLFFVLAGFMSRFHYLRLGLAGVLLFIGAKMLAEPFIDVDIVVSLLVVVGLLAAAVIASLLRKPAPVEAPHP